MGLHFYSPHKITHIISHHITSRHLIEGELLEVDALGLLPGGLVEEGQHWRLTVLKLNLEQGRWKEEISGPAAKKTMSWGVFGVGGGESSYTCTGYYSWELSNIIRNMVELQR